MELVPGAVVPGTRHYRIGGTMIYSPGGVNRDTASVERSFFLFFRSFGFARTNQTELEIIMFLTLSTLTYPKTDFSHK